MENGTLGTLGLEPVRRPLGLPSQIDSRTPCRTMITFSDHSTHVHLSNLNVGSQRTLDLLVLHRRSTLLPPFSR